MNIGAWGRNWDGMAIPRGSFRKPGSRRRAMRPMIIDCHTHIFPDEVRRDRGKYAQKDRAFGEIYRDKKVKMVGVEELIGSMDEAGVDKAVVCGFPYER